MSRRRNFIPGIGNITERKDSQSLSKIKTQQSKPTKEMIEKAAPNVLDDKAMNYIKNRISTIESQGSKTIIIQRKVKKEDTESEKRVKKSGKGLKILK